MFLPQEARLQTVLLCHYANPTIFYFSWNWKYILLHGKLCVQSSLWGYFSLKTNVEEGNMKGILRKNLILLNGIKIPNESVLGQNLYFHGVIFRTRLCKLLCNNYKKSLKDFFLKDNVKCITYICLILWLKIMLEHKSFCYYV